MAVLDPMRCRFQWTTLKSQRPIRWDLCPDSQLALADRLAMALPYEPLASVGFLTLMYFILFLMLSYTRLECSPILVGTITADNVVYGS